MIASSILFSVANFATSAGEFGFRFGSHGASVEMPALPGATMIEAAGVPVRISALTIACSRAPCPKTKIFTGSSLVWLCGAVFEGWSRRPAGGLQGADNLSLAERERVRRIRSKSVDNRPAAG